MGGTGIPVHIPARGFPPHPSFSPAPFQMPMGESAAPSAPVQRQFFPPTAPNGYTFLQHQKSKLLHYMRIEDQRVLACGRMRSQAYSAPSVLRYDSAVCHACQRAAQRD